MKTNTFIFNFINPARLVYLAKDVPVEKPADKGSGAVAEDISGVGAAAAKVAEEKGRIAAEAAKKATGGRKEAEKPKTEQENLGLNDADYSFYKKCVERAKALGKVNDMDGLMKLGEEMKKMQTEDKNAKLFIQTKVYQIYKEAMVAEVTVEPIPTEQRVAEILNGKKDKIKELLEYFAREGYRTGQSAKYNVEILSILGKKNESPENKDKWVRAFQEWAGATPDGATGPRTMLALAGKIGESDLGRRIEGTMIARRTNKPKESAPGTVTTPADLAKERKAQYAALGMPNPLGENEEIPVTKVTRAETYNPSPVEKEKQVTFATESGRKAAELERELASFAEKQRGQTVAQPVQEATAANEPEEFEAGEVAYNEDKDADSDAIDADVASGPKENRAPGAYYNPENPNESGSYYANEVPEGWAMLSEDEENAVTVTSNEEPEKKPIKRRERNVFDNMNAYIDESTGRS